MQVVTRHEYMYILIEYSQTQEDLDYPGLKLALVGAVRRSFGQYGCAFQLDVLKIDCDSHKAYLRTEFAASRMVLAALARPGPNGALVAKVLSQSPVLISL